jgi:hypothetical protein
MFRARFHEVFPRSTPHFGPQDIERGAVELPPGDYIERLLCALLGLVLNRKKDVEYEHLVPIRWLPHHSFPMLVQGFATR